MGGRHENPNVQHAARGVGCFFFQAEDGIRDVMNDVHRQAEYVLDRGDAHEVGLSNALVVLVAHLEQKRVGRLREAAVA